MWSQRSSLRFSRRACRVSDASPQVSKPAIVASAVQQGPARDASTSAAMQLADEACRSICHANLEQPFYSISDAVQQLLPYHVRILIE